MNWDVKIAKKVLKEVKKLPIKDAHRLLFVLREFSENPYGGDIEKIKGERDTWRRRVGSYRIIYDIFSPKRVVWVLDIRRRTTDTY